MNIRAQVHGILWIALAAGFLALPANPQVTPSATGAEAAPEETISGTMISFSRNTMVVKTQAGAYQLFVFDRYTVKPGSVAAGTAVRVSSTPTDELGVRLATQVSASAPSDGSAERSVAGSGPPPEGAVPVSIRKLENDVEHASRRYGMGVRTGATLDPEALLVGVHARFGPFFGRDASFRPNVEFGWGEVTRFFALNLEGVYRLPFTPRMGRWSAYVGTGPSFTFQHQNFERSGGVDFGQFDFKAGLNLLTGLEFRSGLFVEAKTTVYATPHLRLMFGYTF